MTPQSPGREGTSLGLGERSELTVKGHSRRILKGGRLQGELTAGRARGTRDPTAPHIRGYLGGRGRNPGLSAAAFSDPWCEQPVVATLMMLSNDVHLAGDPFHPFALGLHVRSTLT